MSPYKSEKQRRFFHTDTARKQGITKKMVSEFDKASKGRKLPFKKKDGHSMLKEAMSKFK